ncbi:MAG: rhodanese-like domain-containing protein [Proteobacteria bacterium]|nr:rhodanese-like domain-containing protein [Pseudomonadota bacterium]
MKSAKVYLEEAHAIVEKMSVADALKLHGSSAVVFVDVRDSGDIAKSGTVAGAVRVPRGFIEFAADDSMSFYNPALSKDKTLCLLCGAGGQAALAGKTLKEMGYAKVFNIGGFSAWKDAGGPIDPH